MSALIGVISGVMIGYAVTFAVRWGQWQSEDPPLNPEGIRQAAGTEP